MKGRLYCESATRHRQQDPGYTLGRPHRRRTVGGSRRRDKGMGGPDRHLRKTRPWRGCALWA